ncbi:MAG: N,N-dimethylformamidase beta subunit family domain-containing protein, partial [Terriglobales bacterium]
MVFPGLLRASCGSPGNAIEAENCLTGTPQSTWDISGAGDATIQGFADQISVNQGGTINFKISTNASSYHLDIYRMGYYQGNGARLVTTITPSATLPQTQPACLSDVTTGLYDCGNWAVSASWAVPSTAVSGIYFARVVRDDTLGASHIVFVVRNDASHSNILFQTSDLTWQAYNDQGGQNLYGCNGAFDLTCRAFKVSYNRPFHTRVFEPESWVFNGEYPMVRWLEANGYDVTYISGVDTDRSGALLLNHKVWMSNGHDEYVSGNQRANIQAARDAGVDLAFFSGNTMFWKTRWENSIDGTNTSYRTLVCYKETHANAVTDPADPPTWTGTWRDPRFSPPADGGRPENALVGTLFRMNGGQNATLLVPDTDGKMRFWRNTAVASLPSGQTATLAPGAIGAEFDDDEDNGFRPAGLFELSATSVTDSNNVLLDYGTTYGAGTVVHKITMYKAPSGALVFATGTYQWSWGLDANHDRSNLGSATDPSMQQATVNLFADMGVQPVSLQAPLAPASASSDTTAPTSTITSPAPGANLQPGASVTVQGTAVDAGGGVVAGVEVSMDGGATWHPAVGRASWSYTGNTASSGSVTIRSRAVDDSGNLETPSAGVTVNIAEQTCPCTIWPSSAAPTHGDPGPDASVELGVKFQADFAGTITGIRFYKFATNTGTHVGNLWSSSGTLLASGTFTTESASGWQEVDFTTPVAITANTVYIASYHTDVGHYAADSQYFASAGFDNPPLHALQNGVSGGNGLFGYGTGNVFPSSTFNSANYWVDLVYTSTSTVMLNSITVAPSQATIQVGGTQQFTATGHYSDNSTQDITSQVTWSSSNTAAATINSSGLATALSGDGPTITATKGNIKGSALLTIHGAPLVITTTSLPPGGQNSLYSFQIVASGGVLPYTWTLLSGTLPAGLSLASNGQITGTPTTQQTTNFTVQVTDSGTKDSLNPQQTATQALSLAVYPPPLIVSIFPPTAVPTRADVGGDSSLELGVKFRADANGDISAIRYYKSVDNIGTHTGHLWTIGGTLLGSVTFTGETASGWQQANFSSPIPITAGTVYLASYHADFGGYADDLNYFISSGVDNPPLHALRDGISGGNGVFSYGTGTVFPNSSTQGANYWVDVVFVQTVPDTTPPTVISISPSNGASGVDTHAAINVVFSKALDPTTVNSNTVILHDPSNAVVPSTVSYNSDTDTVTLTPTSALQNSATYTVVLEGGSTDPRIKDLVGNALAANFVSLFNTAAPPPPSPTAGPGGPILVVSAAANPLSLYYAEILRAEGLNEFAVLDISQVQSSTLAGYDVVVLGDTPLTSGQVTMFTNWVNGGGNLIAMHPDPQLAGLLGLVDTGSPLSNAYMLMNTTGGPGVGLVGQTIQFHGPAELYTLNGAISFADLYSNASTPSGHPAVTANPVGTGIAVAFTYDLARSIVYQRQGNPAWNGQARDGLIPTRSDDLFFGNAGFDPQPDWVDFNKVQIPQADEQQRLLANLILQMNSIKRPLPRFWYFPRGLQAVVVLTGDDHGTFYPTGGASAARFDQLMEASPVGCSVESWQCLRSTAYVFPPSIASNPLSNAQAADFISAGFEVSVHIDTSPDCSNYTSLSALDANYTAQLSSFATGYPSAPASQTHRMHCVAWSDYDSQPQVEFNHGIRLDTTYYYYPQTWINDRPGLFTGSGMPMRFTTLNGTMVDVYQAPSQMTDESGQTYPLHVDTLLDNALNLGYYGAFVANMHNDTADPSAASSVGAAAILASAQARGVPIISAVQLLKWLDGRNGSSFSLQSWDGATLTFNILVGANAQGLQAMLPAQFSGTPLNSLTLNGNAVSYTLQTIKGMQYAVFAATSNGTYSVQYNAVTSVTVNPTVVVGGDPSTGTVTIISPVLSGGVVVALQSDNPAATIPASVTIAQGQTSAPFNISTSHVLTSTPVHIAGSFNSTSQPATLTLTSQLMPTTAVTVTAGGNPSTYGSSVTFMATVSGPGLAPTGSVSFYDGGTCSTPGATLGISVALNGSAQASVTTSALTAAASPHTILACYSGDVTYLAGAGTLAQAVNPATVTPSITVSSKVYDGTTAATITARSLSGVIGTDNVTLSGGTAAFADKNVGTAKTVTATGLTLSGTTAANYQLSATSATTTANITAAPLTLTASNATRSYGASNPQFTGTIVGLQNNDNITATYSTVAILTSPVGTYAIVPAPVDPGNNLGNYSVTLNNGVLTITAVAATAVSVNPTAVAGGVGATGTVTLSGIAPSGGSVVKLKSSASGVATVPANVTVPAGQNSATFAVTTNAVTTAANVTITATLNGSVTTTLTVNLSLIAQNDWSLLSVDSQETICGNGVGTNAFDGNPSTMWHTQFCPTATPMPHQISINLGASYNLVAFQYLPRQDGSACGWIKDYEFYVSSDGVNWGSPVASGNFSYANLSKNCPGPGAGVPSARQVAFSQTTGQYIRLVALSELHGNPWTSVAELNVLGTVSANNPMPSLAQVTVNPAIVVGGAGVQGTVTLSGPAPAGGVVVTLASSDPSATVPATVTVPANSLSANFTITTAAVGAPTQPDISGSFNSGNAQASFTVNPGSLIPQSGWSLLSVDSQETICGNGVGANAFDGNPSTMWHTQFCPSAAPMPHQISINLGASYNLTAFQYLPRQDGSACGWIKDYAFYVSSDGVNWGTAVATGTFNYGNLSTNCPGPGASEPSAL